MGWLLDGILLGEIKIFQAYTGKCSYSREFLAEYFGVKCHLFQVIHGEKGSVCVHARVHMYTHISMRVESESWGLVGGYADVPRFLFHCFCRLQICSSPLFLFNPVDAAESLLGAWLGILVCSQESTM